MRHRLRCGSRALLFLAIAIAGCDEPPPPPAPEEAEPACPAATVDVPSAGGLPSAAVIERQLRELVTRDLGEGACLARAVVRASSVDVDATHEGETIHARLEASRGSATESLAPHVAARDLFRTLLDAGVENAISGGHAVGLGFADHAAICERAVGRDAVCLRTPPVGGFDSVREPETGHVVLRALSDASGTSGTELSLVVAEPPTLTTRQGALGPARPLGSPPPATDRFSRIHAGPTTTPVPAPDAAAVPIADAMPRGTITVRLETRTVGATRVIVFTRCEGMVAHCVSIVATRAGTTLSVAPSFATEPAQVDAIEDAPAFAWGALRVRIRETGFHEGSASELFVVASDSALRVDEVVLGTETERGDTETITEGCYRTLTVEAPSRVRLMEARGWSGSHSDARGYQLATSRTCAADATLCLDPEAGFAPCP